MLNTAQYTISIVQYFSMQHLLQNAALVICLSLLPAALPMPSQLYGAGGSLCKVSRSRGVSYPPQALHPPWQGGSTCQKKELRGIDTFSCPEAQKRNPNATLLAKPKRLTFSFSPPALWVGLRVPLRPEFHWDHGIFYPSTQNENHICLN